MLGEATRFKLARPLKTRFNKEFEEGLGGPPDGAAAAGLAHTVATQHRAGVRYHGQKTHDKKVMNYLDRLAKGGLMPPGAPHPYPLLHPTSTEEAYRNAETVKQLAAASWPHTPGPMPGANELADRLRTSGFFDATGDRIGGVGEYVYWLHPVFTPGEGFQSPVFEEAELRVYRRYEDGKWWRISGVLNLGDAEVGRRAGGEVAHAG